MIVRAFCPADGVGLAPQAMQAGENDRWTEDFGALLIAGDNRAWTVEVEGRALACGGLYQLYPQTAVAWCLFTGDWRRVAVTVTRLARQQIAEAPWPRIEATVRADWPQAMAWAELAGLQRNALLRRWGWSGIDHWLFERVR